MKKGFFHLSHVISGFVAVLVGFTSSVLIIFQAAHQAGATPLEMSSWLFALGVSLAITSIGFSWYYKMPILIGWSTPGAALLATSLTGVTMPRAIGAFIFASALTAIIGFSGIFERMLKVVPRPITAAMLAGILLRFGLNVFQAFNQDIQLVGMMLMTYVVGKRFFPRYVILLTLVVGIMDAIAQGLFHLEHFQWDMATPIFIFPEFHLQTLISVGIPLFVVTMTSQNITGLSVISGAGYQPPISKIISLTGLTNLVFAPFGCFSISLAAITAAVCTGKESDVNPKYRYKSCMVAGLIWLFIGLMGATIVTLFLAFPKEIVYAIAGLALLNTIASSLNTALNRERDREAAIITMLVTASGLSMMGIGSAFWGLIFGVISLKILSWNTPEEAKVVPSVSN
jgi:benzoate membrane transport protein